MNVVQQMFCYAKVEVYYEPIWGQNSTPLVNNMDSVLTLVLINIAMITTSRICTDVISTCGQLLACKHLMLP